MKRRILDLEYEPPKEEDEDRCLRKKKIGPTDSVKFRLSSKSTSSLSSSSPSLETDNREDEDEDDRSVGDERWPKRRPSQNNRLGQL